MTAPAPATTETAFTSKVVDYAKLRGWRIYHALPGQARAGRWVTGTQGHVGFPDIVAVRDRRVVVAELKVGRNKASAPQTAWLEAFMAANVETYLWLPADWPEIEKVFA
jgi:hypothetical protein